ncbi:tyrosine protein kinase TXK, putative [Entamoeba invadens IP1]|uniref:Tyrosine protein kinase TXK, putative n=1 Tax=Entamoeba invadens IP1 TaxID=370355 RepID=A0A0A1UDU0_ENTIV|nr:tyrosine protein kinase TXK, putative [Entamoeba invadens IP1]ELP94609.1 tyrosine protein kinase TXK, putative [Entamoeba invadens IP1]|eukprot:XP_004261380.1 tyrosine protein kinase TXK, putative [Entamoeba invadens IP1]
MKEEGLLPTYPMEKAERTTQIVCFYRRVDEFGSLFKRKYFTDKSVSVGKGYEVMDKCDESGCLLLRDVDRVVFTTVTTSIELRSTDVVTLGRTVKYEMNVVSGEKYNKGIEFREQLLPNGHIGSGSFSHVMLTYNRVDGKQYAVKHLKEGMEKTYGKKFKGEIEVMKTLGKHAHMIGYVTDFQTENIQYLVMEYVEYPLLGYISQQERIGKYVHHAVCRKVLEDIAGGVVYLEKMKYIHRDIKCGNVLVSSDFQCKIGDFGLCIKECDAQSQFNSIGGVGTVDYLAPEVRSTPAKYSYKSDVWSVGCVLWCVLNGREMKEYRAKYFEELPAMSEYAQLGNCGGMMLEENYEKRLTMKKMVDIGFIKISKSEEDDGTIKREIFTQPHFIQSPKKKEKREKDSKKIQANAMELEQIKVEQKKLKRKEEKHKREHKKGGEIRYTPLFTKQSAKK